MLLIASAVRAIAKEHGKQVKPEFLEEINRRVTNKIIQACQVHNGGRVKLDATIAALVFGGIH